MGAALEGSGKPFVITTHANGVAAENVALLLAERGVRTSIVELCPSVHGEGDTGFVPRLINIAKTKGFSAYVEGGPTAGQLCTALTPHIYTALR